MTKKGRIYTDPLTGDEYLSVTSIINTAHPFGGTDWAAWRVADLAIEEWDKVAALHALDPASARNYLGKSVSAYTNRRADIGTTVHAAMEAHFKGLPLPFQNRSLGFDRGRQLDDAGWEEAEQTWHQLHALLDRIQLRPWRVEPLLVNRKLGYAGSGDIIAASTEWEGLEVVDLKTKPQRKKPNPEVVLQLSAYGMCEVVLEEDGTETEIEDGSVSYSHAHAIVASKVAAEVYPVDLDFPAFMHAHGLSKFYSEGVDFAPIQLQALETPEEVAAQIVAAQSYAELQALYYRHVARGKWLPSHTEMAAERKEELERG